MVKILRQVAVLFAGVAAILLALAAAPAHAQEGDDELRVTFLSLEDGSVFAEVPYVIQLCFSEPVDIDNSGEGGGFSFEITTPEDRGLGKRISFQRDGLGVEIFPGGIPALPTGFAPAADQTWTFEWRVTAQDDEAPAEGTLTFTLDDDGEVVPEESLPRCRGEDPDSTPTVSGTDDDGDDGGDELYIVLLAAAAIGALLAVGLVGYLIRRRR